MLKPFKHKSGIILYRGSDTSDAEKELIKMMGNSKPKNEYQEKLKDSINEIGKKGRIVDIPSM